MFCFLIPIFQIEMETMNTTAYCVNELSKALDMERKRYQSYLARVVQTVEKRRKECQRQLERSEPFFKVLKEVRELQFRSRTAAARYEAASQKHHAAKMKVAMAERQLEERLQCGESGNPVLDEAWQETLANGVEQVSCEVADTLYIHLAVYTEPLYDPVEQKSKEKTLVSSSKALTRFGYL